MSAVAEAAIGRERRRHGRWSVTGAYAVIQGRKIPLIDISIGGFFARLPDDGGQMSSPLEGTIYWRGARETIEFPFGADIVRRPDEGGSFAAQFHSLEGEAIDTLLRFLSAIEAERRERIERHQRRAERRVLLRKLAFWGVVGISLLAALWLVWTFGLGGA